MQLAGEKTSGKENEMQAFIRRTLVAFLLICFLAVPVMADEILDSLNEAQEAYNDKAYSEALEALEYAKQLILQMSSENMAKFLPEPPEGWQGKEAVSQNLGMLGGSSSIEKIYTRTDQSNGGRVTMTIMGESPMFMGLINMFNPAIAASDGGKLQKIKRNKAIVKYTAQNRSGEIMVNVAKKFIITINGNNIDEQELMLFAESIDYTGLKALQ